MAASTDNYYIGKGVVTFTPSGGASRDLGNVPEFELTPEITTLDHFSSRAGVRSLDKSVVVEKKATLRMVLEEYTAENLALALIGTQSTDGTGQKTIDIFSLSEVTGVILFTGSNSVGKKFTLSMTVSFKPASSLAFISEEWGQMEVTADVVLTDSSFGLLTELAA